MYLVSHVFFVCEESRLDEKEEEQGKENTRIQNRTQTTREQKNKKTQGGARPEKRGKANYRKWGVNGPGGQTPGVNEASNRRFAPKKKLEE